MDTTALYNLLSQRAPIHTNHITDCVIWDGEMDRLHRPVMDVGGSRVQVRKWIANMIGQISGNGVIIKASCENDKCVKLDHFLVEKGEVADNVDFTEDELIRLEEHISQGFKQEKIAELMGTSRTRISRLVKVLKDRGEANA